MYMVPVNPLNEMKTMNYAYITTIELHNQQGQKPILICGTSMGTCLVLDAEKLQVLQSFTHLSMMKAMPINKLLLGDKDLDTYTIPS